MKKLFLKFKEQYSNFLNKYPFTNIWSIISGILVCFCYKGVIHSDFLLFIVTLLACFIFVETFISKLTKKIIPGIISIILSILVYIYLPDKGVVLALIYIGMMLILGILTISKIVRDKKYPLDKYIYKLFVDYIPLYIIQSLLVSGVFFAGIILDNLIFNNTDLDFTMYSQIILFFALLFPINLYVLTETPNINTKIIDKIITYVLIPITMVINLLMIIYTLKCLFTWSLPEIQVFAIILVIYLATYFTVLLSNNIEDKNKFVLFNNKYILMFLCINLAMQIFSLVVRFYYYGITLSRMICIYIIIFEIISIFIYYFKKNKYINKLLDVSLIMVIFACIIPFINVYELPLYYHGNKVINYIEKNNISKKDAISSYKYLEENLDGEDYNKKYLHGKTIKNIEKKICFEDGKYICNDYEYQDVHTDYFNFSYTNELDIDVSNYSRLKYYSDTTEEFNIKDLKEYKVGNYTFNMYDLLYKIIELDDEEKANKYFENNYIITIDNNNVFVIEDIMFDYNSKDSSSNYLSISGYVLSK